MSRLKTIAILLPVILLLIVGGTWGYVWYTTKQQVDQIVTLAKPFADISYGGIEVSPSGSIGIKRLQVILNLLNDSFSVNSIRLNAPDMLALLAVRQQLNKGELPEALSLSMDQLELSFDGGLLSASQSTYRTPLENLDVLGCGALKTIGSKEWQAMGYNNLITNLKMGYQVNKAQNQLAFQLDSYSRDWATVNLAMSLATSAPLVSMTDLATALTPKLAKLNLVMRDEGLNQRRTQYCATLAGKPVEAYLADHVRLVVEQLKANGIYLGPGLIEAYRLYLKDGGQLTLTASPPAPIDPSELHLYKAEDIIKLLGLSLKVNETAVTDLSVSWDAAKVAQFMTPKPQAHAEEEAEEQEESQSATPRVEPPPTTIRKSYHPISVGDLGQHSGKIAKLKTRNQTEYKGQLGGIAEGIIKITVYKPGGSATFSLRLNEIIDAQILY